MGFPLILSLLRVPLASVASLFDLPWYELVPPVILGFHAFACAIAFRRLQTQGTFAAPAWFLALLIAHPGLVSHASVLLTDTIAADLVFLSMPLAASRGRQVPWFGRQRRRPRRAARGARAREAVLRNRRGCIGNMAAGGECSPLDRGCRDRRCFSGAGQCLGPPRCRPDPDRRFTASIASNRGRPSRRARRRSAGCALRL
jgi:hypothetical protein